MHLTFSPARRDTPLALSVTGDILTFNGKVLDLSGIPEGATLPHTAIDCDWIISDVERIEGEIHLTLSLPHGPNAPQETRFPAPLHLTSDGPVILPPYDTVNEEETA